MLNKNLFHNSLFWVISDFIEQYENDLPEELQNGYANLIMATFRGATEAFDAYLDKFDKQKEKE